MEVEIVKPPVDTSKLNQKYTFKSLNYHSSCVLGTKKNKIFTFGGHSPFHSEVFQYNIENSKLKLVKPKNVILKGISGFKTALIPKVENADGKIFDGNHVLVGVGEVDNYKYNSSYHAFDIKRKKWRNIDALLKGSWEIPVRLEGYTYNRVGNVLFMLGGGAEDKFTNFVHKLDLETFTWTKIAPKGKKENIPPPFFYHCAELHDGKIYVFGGECGCREKYFTSNEHIFVFDTKSLNWVDKISIPKGVFPKNHQFISVSVKKDNFVVIVDDDIRIFDLEKNEWHCKGLNNLNVIGTPIPKDFDRGTISLAQDRIFLIGGFKKGEAPNNGIFELKIKKYKE